VIEKAKTFSITNYLLGVLKRTAYFIQHILFQ